MLEGVYSSLSIYHTVDLCDHRGNHDTDCPANTKIPLVEHLHSHTQPLPQIPNPCHPLVCSLICVFHHFKNVFI